MRKRKQCFRNIKLNTQYQTSYFIFLIYIQFYYSESVYDARKKKKN